MFIIIIFAFACAGDPPPSGKDMVVVGDQALDAQGKPVAAAPAGTPFDAVAVSCCGAGQQPLAAYLRAAQALSKDDAATAATALHELAANVEAPLLADAARPLATMELKPMREGFKALSVQAAAFARDNPGGTLKIAAVWCPMAPGWWLQTAAQVENPYHGSEMLRCGSFVALDQVK